ncbi:MAG: MiaB/RimO family radical SAM methylthiotransferase, partial [Rubrivivax sp.]|nr:MiaB/RimO family radical SAM methylthiotransferase [Rubrivivax sp.]
GCSKYCSYCVVPYTRGEEVHRPFEDVLTEVAGLADQGVKEVTLLGQNVNAYRGRMGGTSEIADFALLIEYVADIPGIERIRYTTSHPNEFTQRLVDVYAKVPNLVSHLHLPVQHGSDRILMAMKRGYTAMEYKSTIRKLRAVRPDISLSSDFIVGFPGETQVDLVMMMKLIDDVGYDSSFSFVFSARPGTPAANLPDDTPQALKFQRLQLLQARIEENVRRISASRAGTVQRILVEGPSRNSGKAGKAGSGAQELMGRTACNRIVNFDGGPQAARLVGQMLDVHISSALPHSLRGELLLHDGHPADGALSRDPAQNLATTA